MAKMTRLVGAMHGDPRIRKEDGVRHVGLVVLIAVVIDFHAEGLEGAVRGALTSPPVDTGHS
jgi:hypothetical protein